MEAYSLQQQEHPEKSQGTRDQVLPDGHGGHIWGPCYMPTNFENSVLLQESLWANNPRSLKSCL